MKIKFEKELCMATTGNKNHIINPIYSAETFCGYCVSESKKPEIDNAECSFCNIMFETLYKFLEEFFNKEFNRLMVETPKTDNMSDLFGVDIRC